MHEDVMNIKKVMREIPVYQPDAWSYLVWVCIILINSHIACDAVMCFSCFLPLLKSRMKK